jgi:hypothetical protein
VLAHAARGIALGRELAAILAALDAQGLPALPYKGPALAAAVYGSPTLRQPGDLDLLVPDACLAGARAVLLDRGYRDALAGVAPEARVSHYQHAMVRDRDGIRLELHWAFAPRYFGFRLPVAAVAREPLVLHGRRVAAIAPVDLLVVLAVHGGRHLWGRLAWVCDVAELLRARPDLDGAATLARAEALGARRMLLVALALARDLLGAALPGPLGAATAADRAAGALARRLGARILEERAGDPGLAAAAWLHLAMRERWRDRIAYALRAPFTPSERDAPRSGRSAALRGLGRPLRLLRDRARRPPPAAAARGSAVRREVS